MLVRYKEFRSCIPTRKKLYINRLIADGILSTACCDSSSCNILKFRKLSEKRKESNCLENIEPEMLKTLPNFQKMFEVANSQLEEDLYPSLLRVLLWKQYLNTETENAKVANKENLNWPLS